MFLLKDKKSYSKNLSVSIFASFCLTNPKKTFNISSRVFKRFYIKKSNLKIDKLDIQIAIGPAVPSYLVSKLQHSSKDVVKSIHLATIQ